LIQKAIIPPETLKAATRAKASKNSAAIWYRTPESRPDRRAENRSRRSHAKERLANPLVKAYVEYHLIHDGWTPEGIAGRLSLDFPELKTNYESIHLWIYTERRDLISYLVREHRKPQRNSAKLFPQKIQLAVDDTEKNR
jgi:hypothetical protein